MVHPDEAASSTAIGWLSDWYGMRQRADPAYLSIRAIASALGPSNSISSILPLSCVRRWFSSSSSGSSLPITTARWIPRCGEPSNRRASASTNDGNPFIFVRLPKKMRVSIGLPASGRGGSGKSKGYFLISTLESSIRYPFERYMSNKNLLGKLMTSACSMETFS